MAIFTPLVDDAAAALAATSKLEWRRDATFVRYVHARTLARLTQHLLAGMDAAGEGATGAATFRADLLRRQADAVEAGQRAAISYRFLTFRLVRTRRRWEGA